jgi:flagellar motility protein MotE (MotC chaperone)
MAGVCTISFQLNGDEFRSGIRRFPCSTTLNDLVAAFAKSYGGEVTELEYVDISEDELLATADQLDFSKSLSDIANAYGDKDGATFNITIKKEKKNRPSLSNIAKLKKTYKNAKNAYDAEYKKLINALKPLTNAQTNARKAYNLTQGGSKKKSKTRKTRN